MDEPADYISFEGGPGDTIERAIVVRGARGSVDGVRAEYQYLGELLGVRGEDWRLEQQSLVHQGGRSYDRMDLELRDGQRRVILFDITEFYGR